MLRDMPEVPYMSDLDGDAEIGVGSEFSQEESSASEASDELESSPETRRF